MLRHSSIQEQLNGTIRCLISINRLRFNKQFNRCLSINSLRGKLLLFLPHLSQYLQYNTQTTIINPSSNIIIQLILQLHPNPCNIHRYRRTHSLSHKAIILPIVIHILHNSRNINSLNRANINRRWQLQSFNTLFNIRLRQRINPGLHINHKGLIKTVIMELTISQTILTINRFTRRLLSMHSLLTIMLNIHSPTPSIIIFSSNISHNLLHNKRHLWRIHHPPKPDLKHLSNNNNNNPRIKNPPSNPHPLHQNP